MFVGMVSPGLRPQLGGVETLVARIADELHASGQPLAVYTQFSGSRTEEPREPYPVYRFRSWTGGGHLRFAPGLPIALRRHAPHLSIIHAHNFHSAVPLMAWLTTDAPLVFTPHFHGIGVTRSARLMHFAYDRLATRIFDAAAAVTCVSHAEAHLLSRAFPIAEGKLTIIENGVDVDEIASAKPISIDRPVALVAGRLVAYKRVDLAIRAVAQVPDVQLVICGVGTEMRTLQRLVRSLGVRDRVDFRGQVSTGEVRRWQRTAHVAISLSLYEAFGLAAAEAAVAGCHVIASNIPAHRELRDRLLTDAQMLVVDEAAPAIADAIRTALALPRFSPGVQGLRTWSDIANSFSDLYHEVLTG